MSPEKDYQKFADDAVHTRALEDGISRLRMALFVAALGPIGVGAIKVFNVQPVAPWMKYAILATVPLGFLLLLINFVRMPASGKFGKITLVTGLLTIAACAGTLFLMRHFSLR